MLTLPVLDEVERLEGADDILCLDRSHVAHQPDRQLALVISKEVHQHVRPVTANKDAGRQRVGTAETRYKDTHARCAWPVCDVPVHTVTQKNDITPRTQPPPTKG